jgi:hypothetical protein
LVVTKFAVVHFQGDEMPEPKSMLEATSEANNLASLSESKDYYTHGMESVCGGDKPYINEHVIEIEHLRIRFCPFSSCDCFLYSYFEGSTIKNTAIKRHLIKSFMPSTLKVSFWSKKSNILLRKLNVLSEIRHLRIKTRAFHSFNCFRYFPNV